MSEKNTKKLRRQIGRNANRIVSNYMEQNSNVVVEASIDVLQRQQFKIRLHVAIGILFGNNHIPYKLKHLLFFLLDWTWCFPQTLLGFIITHTIWQNSKKRDARLNCISDIFHVVISVMQKGQHYNWLSGFSLGRYICLQEWECDLSTWLLNIYHECGHTRQSRRLGWLYLFVVGIPSVINNLRARRNKHIAATYYERFPEKGQMNSEGQEI
ncbi:hypothetical protein HMPREF9554_01196 [Treponema phagedenis F0421]|uniref:hypothetical protein n=1 Tax=Treponema phagedenis TaxID=162 RepID=UPI0001F6417D|nr:hypothetical protein [Treponema phagedenis]EFW38298.1 hypothetical protein HMPREF9554_01196 [Treponema phagedenis F0421]